MINIILWIIFGGLAGWVASLILRTDEQQGVIANIVVGSLGAIIGGFLSQLVIGRGVDGFNISSFIIAVIGALIFLSIFKALFNSPSSR